MPFQTSLLFRLSLTETRTTPSCIEFSLSDCLGNGIPEKGSDLPRLWGSGYRVESSYRVSFLVPVLSRIKSRLTSLPPYSSPWPPRKPEASFLCGCFTKPPTIVLERNQAAPVGARFGSSGELRGTGRGGKEGRSAWW